MKLKDPPPPDYVFRYRTWPADGNAINGLGERRRRRPRLVFHWQPGRGKPHPFLALEMGFMAISGMGGPLFGWGMIIERLRNLWMLRRADGPVAESRIPVDDPAAMSRQVRAWAAELGECKVGVAPLMPEHVLEGEEVPYRNVVMIAHPMRRERMETVPRPEAAHEVMAAYRRTATIAVRLAERIRALGWPAKAYGDPKSTGLMHIPHGIEAGIGVLGKHGSLINREWGSNFRMAAVATDLPMAMDAPEDIGVDDLCVSCRRCTVDCPADAIFETKQTVRGVEKWYVDFDRCVPYFSENRGCAICIEVCPWSEPGRGFKLSEMLLAKRGAADAPRAAE